MKSISLKDVRNFEATLKKAGIAIGDVNNMTPAEIIAATIFVIKQELDDLATRHGSAA